MPDYNVTRAIQGDRRYDPGEAITLTTKEAKELATLGAIDPKPIKVAPASKGGKSNSQEPDEEGKTGETVQS
jgi:hypothetical protein